MRRLPNILIVAVFVMGCVLYGLGYRRGHASATERGNEDMASCVDVLTRCVNDCTGSGQGAP
jgi:hypothetical protein